MPIAKATATWVGSDRDYTVSDRRFERDVPTYVEGEALIKKLESIGGFRIVRKLPAAAPVEPQAASPIASDPEPVVEAPVEPPVPAPVAPAPTPSPASAQPAFAVGKGPVSRKKG